MKTRFCLTAFTMVTASWAYGATSAAAALPASAVGEVSTSTAEAGTAKQQERLRGIDAQLWRPFMALFAAGDAEAYIALRAPTFVRVGDQPRRLVDRATYAAQTRAMFASLRERGLQAGLEVRFQERLGDDARAFETGVWAFKLIRRDGSAVMYYGRFQVLLERINGAWQLVLDEDQPLGKEDGERLFAAAKPVTAE